MTFDVREHVEADDLPVPLTYSGADRSRACELCFVVCAIHREVSM